jgi:branched-chain amino acid transport system ATP-binding protein
MTVLEAKNLSKNFGGVQAVRGVSLSVRASELLAMIGPNGAGKTTCFNLLNGQLEADGGSVSLNGRELSGMKPRGRWRLGLARTFQVAATFSSMTARENVQLGLLARHGRLADLWCRVRGLYGEEADALLARVGMREQSGRLASVLAYGDVKRLELAVALAGEPRVLLMDEPTAGMAARERAGLMALAAEIARERRIAVLFTEHDMDVVFRHADRIIVLDRGRVIAEGGPEQIRSNPEVRRVYLGSQP